MHINSNYTVKTRCRRSAKNNGRKSLRHFVVRVACVCPMHSGRLGAGCVLLQFRRCKASRLIVPPRECVCMYVAFDIRGRWTWNFPPICQTTHTRTCARLQTLICSHATYTLPWRCSCMCGASRSACMLRAKPLAHTRMHTMCWVCVCITVV